MRLSDQGRIAAPPLPETLKRIRHTLNCDQKNWAELLSMKVQDYMLVETGQKPIDILSLAELSRSIGVSLDKIETGSIDWRALASQMAGQADALPEKYQAVALSKRRTSITALDYLEDFFGWNTRLAVLRHHQVFEAAFLDPDSYINLRFLKDTLSFLSERGFQDFDFETMGAYSVITNAGTPIARRVSLCRTPMEAYDLLINEIAPTHFDRNHRYTLLELGHSSCRFKIDTSEELLSELSLADVTSESLCAYRRGVASSVTGYLDLPHARVEEARCLHEGDAWCELIVDYSTATALNSKRPSFRQPLLAQ